MRDLTELLSVGLDVESADDAGPLVDALAPIAYDLHYEPTPAGIQASFELRDDEALDADATIQRFTETLLALPADARKVWDGATLRRFSIGVRAGAGPHSFTLPLQPETIQSVAALRASIELVVYGAGREK